jgi:hypothetical protein
MKLTYPLLTFRVSIMPAKAGNRDPGNSQKRCARIVNPSYPR